MEFDNEKNQHRIEVEKRNIQKPPTIDKYK